MIADDGIVTDSGEISGHGNCPKCGSPLTIIEGFWKVFLTPHCLSCLLETPKP